MDSDIIMIQIENKAQARQVLKVLAEAVDDGDVSGSLHITVLDGGQDDE